MIDNLQQSFSTSSDESQTDGLQRADRNAGKYYTFGRQNNRRTTTISLNFSQKIHSILQTTDLILNLSHSASLFFRSHWCLGDKSYKIRQILKSFFPQLQSLLELLELQHEALVWPDFPPFSSYESEGFIRAHSIFRHQISDDDGGTSGDALSAVHQDGLLLCHGLLNEVLGFLKVGRDILEFVVSDSDVHVPATLDLPRLQLLPHRHDVLDAQLPQQLAVGRSDLVADVQAGDYFVVVALCVVLKNCVGAKTALSESAGQGPRGLRQHFAFILIYSLELLPISGPIFRYRQKFRHKRLNVAQNGNFPFTLPSRPTIYFILQSKSTAAKPEQKQTSWPYCLVLNKKLSINFRLF